MIIITPLFIHFEEGCMRKIIISALISLLSLSAFASDVVVTKTSAKSPKLDSTWGIDAPTFSPVTIHNETGGFKIKVIVVADKWIGTQTQADAVNVICNGHTIPVAPGGDAVVCLSQQDVQIVDTLADKHGASGRYSLDVV